MRITAEIFKEKTGKDPVDDDLERANCSSAGELGHFHCGWNQEKDLPQSMTEAFIKPIYQRKL